MGDFLPFGGFATILKIKKWDVKTELLMLPNAEKSAHLALLPPPVKNRHNRRKTHLAWEQADRASDGLYSHNMELIERKFPELTPMQLRVCAMVKAHLTSWLIAKKLGISERTVEGHCTNAHKKMKIPPRKQLIHYLARL
jgi:DNA-binding CsgD family transcriptional regulator